MTKATSETTKLNFITDQGSTRATVRWACRAVRFDFPFRDVFRIVTGPALAAVLPASVLPGLAGGPALDGAALDGAALGAAELFADVPDRRNVRAGDDGESAGGSDISHANAAAETDGGSAGASGGALEGRRPDDTVPNDAVPDDGRPDGTVLEGEVSAPDGFVPDSAGSAAAVAASAGGGLKLNADES